MYWPVTIYWESPENAQSHIQPRDVSPGLLLLMLSSVISEKLDVLQILQVWSAEQVANRLEKTTNRTQSVSPERRHGRKSSFFVVLTIETLIVCRGEGHSRRVRAELAAEGVALVCRNLSLWNELSHFIADASGEVPHITVPLLEEDKRNERGCFNH